MAKLELYNETIRNTWDTMNSAKKLLKEGKKHYEELSYEKVQMDKLKALLDNLTKRSIYIISTILVIFMITLVRGSFAIFLASATTLIMLNRSFKDKSVLKQIIEMLSIMYPTIQTEEEQKEILMNLDAHLAKINEELSNQHNYNLMMNYNYHFLKDLLNSQLKEYKAYEKEQKKLEAQRIYNQALKEYLIQNRVPEDVVLNREMLTSSVLPIKQKEDNFLTRKLEK